MVFALITIGVIVVALFTFQNEIKGFVSDIRKPKSEEQIERDERGAVENTQAFILGEKGLADLKQTSEENRVAINKFISDSQKNIDLGIQGVNTTLVEAQQNLEKFAQDSQANIVKTVDDSSKAFNQSISGVGEGFSKFFQESALNIQNFFGGQTMPKAIATSVTQNPPITTKQGTPVVDLSFLTPTDTLEGQGSKVETQEAEMVVQTDRTTSSRFGGSGSRR